MTIKRVSAALALILTVCMSIVMMTATNAFADDEDPTDPLIVSAVLLDMSPDSVTKQDSYQVQVRLQNTVDAELSGARLRVALTAGDNDDAIATLDGLYIDLPAIEAQGMYTETYTLTLDSQEVANLGVWDSVTTGALVAEVTTDIGGTQDSVIGYESQGVTYVKAAPTPSQDTTPAKAPTKNATKSPKTGETSVPFAPVAALALIGAGAAALVASKKEMNK